LRAEFAGDAALSSGYTYVEMCAGLAAALRARRFRPVMRTALLTMLDGLWSQITVLPVDEAALSSAGALAEAAGLGAGDALQLATLLSIAGLEPRFACWDIALREAAAERGFALVPEQLPR
jgi:hypothetical protein